MHVTNKNIKLHVYCIYIYLFKNFSKVMGGRIDKLEKGKENSQFFKDTN